MACYASRKSMELKSLTGHFSGEVIRPQVKDTKPPSLLATLHISGTPIEDPCIAEKRSCLLQSSRFPAVWELEEKSGSDIQIGSVVEEWS